MRDIKATFKALFLIGTLILCFGFILVWIPELGISGLKEQLNQATLSGDKVGLEQVISAENMNLLTFYQPISNILKMVGGLMIAYSVISTTFNIAVENRCKKAMISEGPNFVERKSYTVRTKLNPFTLRNNVEQELPLDKIFLTSSLDTDFKKKKF